jgi:hypothetical protein
VARQTLATPKTYPNAYEQRFAEMARSLGWKVTKQGWPDFFCYDPETEGVIFVEVKPPGVKLRAHQWLVMRSLARLGIKCFISDGTSLSPIDPDDSLFNLVEPALSQSDWLI